MATLGGTDEVGVAITVGLDGVAGAEGSYMI